jgi:hypothetical protein
VTVRSTPPTPPPNRPGRRRSSGQARARASGAAKLAADREAACKQVDALIETRQPGEYDTAVEILTDLCAIGEREETCPSFATGWDSYAVCTPGSPAALIASTGHDHRDRSHQVQACASVRRYWTQNTWPSGSAMT